MYARTSFFFSSFHGVLFRHYSEDRNAGVQLRLPVTCRIGPAVDNAATSRVAGIPFPSPSLSLSSSSSSFLTHSFPRARLFILANVLLLPCGRYTTRVFNLVHLIVGFVGAFVRVTCSYLGRQSITSSRSRRTRTLLSPYVNELLIFRASNFFFFFFSFPLFLSHLPRPPRFIISTSSFVLLARTTGSSNVCHYEARINSSLLFNRVAKPVTNFRWIAANAYSRLKSPARAFE